MKGLFTVLSVYFCVSTANAGTLTEKEVGAFDYSAGVVGMSTARIFTNTISLGKGLGSVYSDSEVALYEQMRIEHQGKLDEVLSSGLGFDCWSTLNELEKAAKAIGFFWELAHQPDGILTPEEHRILIGSGYKFNHSKTVKKAKEVCK